MAKTTRNTRSQRSHTVEPPGDDPRAARLIADGVMSLRAFCAFANVSRTTAWREMDAGRLAYVRNRRRRLIPVAEARAYLVRGLRTGPIKD